MRYRTLGRTGITVSEIGFGTWGLGGDSYGDVLDSESISTLREAYNQGITFYDTSDLYGNGHSEKILGQALAAERENVVICSKGGLLPHKGFDMPCNFTADYLRAAVDRSLSRLNTDYIDVYLLHSPTIAMLEGNHELFEMLNTIKQAGKIKAFGLSARTPSDALIAIKKFNFDVVEVNFNLIDQRAIDIGLLEHAKAENVGVIARTPLCFGYLSGKLDGSEKFSGNDHRANWPKDQLKRWACAPNLFGFLVDGKDISPAQFALRFCLDYEGISTVIPGMMEVSEVLENSKASDVLPLNSEELNRVKLVYNSNEFYDKKAKG